MSKRENLGEFEHLLLAAAIRLGDEAYGVTLKREIEGRARRSVTLGAIYPTMDRLEARGLVRSRMAEPTGQRGGRSRRIFSVTALGVTAAERAYHVFQSMWEGMEPSSLRSSE